MSEKHDTMNERGEDREMDEQYEFQVGDRDLNDTTLGIEFQDDNADSGDE